MSGGGGDSGEQGPGRDGGGLVWENRRCPQGNPITGVVRVNNGRRRGRGFLRLLKKYLDASATSHAAYGDGSRPGFLDLGGHPPGPLYPRSRESFSSLLASQGKRCR